MAKKALISKLEPRGVDNSGFRVLEVVEVGAEFEVHPTHLEWVDCSDTVTGPDMYWYNPSTQQFKKTDLAVDQGVAGALNKDADGNPTEKYVFDWDNETWIKEPI